MLFRSKTDNGYSTPTNWLEENVDLSGSVDMVIDGNIYALRADGNIIKMLKGKTENFSIETPNPPIAKASKLILAPELNFIYIFEAEQSRLVVYNKDNKFVLQYKIDNLTNIKDLIVDEKNRAIYVLTGTAIYKFGTGHIK